MRVGRLQSLAGLYVGGGGVRQGPSWVDYFSVRFAHLGVEGVQGRVLRPGNGLFNSLK